MNTDPTCALLQASELGTRQPSRNHVSQLHAVNMDSTIDIMFGRTLLTAQPVTNTTKTYATIPHPHPSTTIPLQTATMRASFGQTKTTLQTIVVPLRQRQSAPACTSQSETPIRTTIGSMTLEMCRKVKQTLKGLLIATPMDGTHQSRLNQQYK